MNAKALIVVVAVVLVAAGGGYYYFSNQGGGETTSELPTVLDPVKDDSDPSISYLDDVDTDSPEFVKILKDDDYIDRAKDIKKAGQQKLDDLSKSTNSRIRELLKQIDDLTAASGYKENGILMSENQIERLMGSGGNPLESYPSFRIRCILHYEAWDTDDLYEKINEVYISKLPKDFTNVFREYGVENDYESDKSIVGYVCNNVRTGEIRDPETNEWVPYHKYEGDPPAGTTMEFIEALYSIFDGKMYDAYGDALAFIYDAESIEGVFTEKDIKEIFGPNKKGDVSLGYVYDNLNSLKNTNYYHLNDCLDKMPTEYSDKIRGCMDQIFEIFDNYPEEVQKLQAEIQNEMAELQKEKLGQK